MTINPSSLSSSKVAQMLGSQRVIVMIGSGGVGKTTSSVALAVAAARAGRKVGLLSIDPAKRLADALGIRLGHELSVVHIPGASEAGGSLRAAMLDQKIVFDNMVRKHAPSERIAEKILKDPMYIAASTNLSGPLEYMALARLQELVDDPSMDLVILDTPPDTHALDFLGRPNVLAGFLEGKVMSKILKPVVFAGRLGLSGIATMSEKLLGGVTSVTGFGALKKFGEFILLMQEVIEGFHKSGERVIEILKRPSSSFIIVVVPTRASVRSAQHLVDQLNELQYSLDGVIFNRALPNQSHSGHDKLEGTEKEIIKTRSKGESAVISELRDHASRNHRNANLWTISIAEKTEDLCSVDAIVKLSDELMTAP
ncbi:MAG: AAA family ATPase [Proteobacteria bacterium]|nr:AAA family ATPase [Pseudomonadota bacterium]